MMRFFLFFAASVLAGVSMSVGQTVVTEKKQTKTVSGPKSVELAAQELRRRSVAGVLHLLPKNFESFFIAHRNPASQKKHIVRMFVELVPRRSEATRIEFRKAVPEFGVMVASKFVPRGLGLGDFKGMHVTRFKHSVAKFVGLGVKHDKWLKLKKTKKPTYELPMHEREWGINSKQYIVVVDNNTLCYVTRKSLLPGMNNDQNLDEGSLRKWASFAGEDLDLSSSMLVLRRYANDRYPTRDLASLSRRSETPQGFSIERMAFVMKSWGPSFKLSMVTKVPETAATFFAAALLSERDGSFRKFKDETYTKTSSELKLTGSFRGTGPIDMIGIPMLCGFYLRL